MKRLHAVVVIASLLVVLLALILSAVSRLWFLLIFLPAFVLPLLRALGVLKDLDERQRLNSYRSSNLAFYFLILMLLVVIIDYGFGVEESARIGPDQLLFILILAISFKYVGGLVLNLQKRQAGIIIGFIVGGWVLIFVIVSHGFPLDLVSLLMEGSIGFFAIFAALLALRWPIVAAIMMFLEGVVLATLSLIRLSQPMIALVAISLPLFVAGWLMISSVLEARRNDSLDKDGSIEQ